jgi:hypothetical protein
MPYVCIGEVAGIVASGATVVGGLVAFYSLGWTGVGLAAGAAGVVAGVAGALWAISNLADCLEKEKDPRASIARGVFTELSNELDAFEAFLKDAIAKATKALSDAAASL